ncbi:MarR family winged helix-turn-helix transcriptional regulator [Marinicella sp. W31]|uniref:MarR family winged helix-turn-helix transcriptional regulator n=1 Tax=Marinicella sp. W31 TaxID=3023713 RepID=UPI003756EB38
MSLQSRVSQRIDPGLSFHGISLTEFLVMHYLNNAPKKTMRRIDLAHQVGLTASGVTRLLLPMEKIKLIEKETNPRDARVSLVKLSATGERVLAEASISFEQSCRALLHILTEKEQAHFLELSEKLLV